MERKTLIKLFAFLIVTVLPVFIFLYFRDRNNFANTSAPHRLWAIGTDTVNGKIDTVYHQLPIFVAQNADGRMISTAEMDGRISVVDIFFAQCPSICPIMNKQMERVFLGLGPQNDRFKIFSYTIDPARDSLPALKKYAEEHHADLSQWYFLRAHQDSVFKFGRDGLKIPVDREDEENSFLHSERFVLVDWNRNIRGYYMGTDSAEVNRLMNDIVLLLSAKDIRDKKMNKK